MALVLPITVAPEPKIDTEPQRPADLRELAESATSLGSYCLRWQMVEPAARNAAH